MSRLSRYVFRQILGPTVAGLLVYGLVLVMNLLLEAAELLVRRSLPLSMVLQYMVLSLPRILVLVIPMAILLGILIGIGRLSAENEITAMRACGISDRRLLTPVILLGLLAGVVSATLFNVLVPRANYAQHLLNARIFLAADINREIQPRVFYERIPSMLIYADATSPEKGTLQRVLIYQRTPAGAEEFSMAGTASMSQRASEGSIHFQLDDVVSHSWTSVQPDLYQVSRSRSQTIDRPADLAMQEMIRSLATPPPRNLREQTLPELRSTLRELRGLPDGPSVRRQVSETLVEVHKKLALPVAPVVFSCLALPLALGRRRHSSRTWGFVVSLVVIIVSYALLTVGEQLADRGRVPAWIAMWMGNLLFALLAAALLVTRTRRALAPPLAALVARFRRRPERPSSTSSAATGEVFEAGRAERLFPSLLDRYLLRHLLALSAFVAASLTILFTLFNAINLVDDLARSGGRTGLLVQYLLYLQPQIFFSYVCPISLCIGTLVSFALLARTQELLAIRAGGVGLLRVAVPFVTAGAAMALLSFAAHDAILPHTNQDANLVRDQIRNRSPRSYRQPFRRWAFASGGPLVNFGDFNPGRGEFQDLAIFRFAPGGADVAERFFAAKASWDSGAWLLKDGWVRRFAAGVESYSPFTSMRVTSLDPPDYFTQDWKAPDQMNYRELRRHVLDLERRGYDTRELRVGLHRKVALPCVCIVMVLLGLPFALRVEHRGPMLALGVSIMLAFAYYATLHFFGKLGEVAFFPPLLAVWAPNLLFGGLGLYLTATARW